MDTLVWAISENLGGLNNPCGPGAGQASRLLLVPVDLERGHQQKKYFYPISKSYFQHCYMVDWNLRVAVFLSNTFIWYSSSILASTLDTKSNV